MLSDFLLFVKYPYTAGIIVVIWLGSSIFLSIDPTLDMIDVVIVDLAATLIIAGVGFRSGKEF